MSSSVTGADADRSCKQEGCPPGGRLRLSRRRTLTGQGGVDEMKRGGFRWRNELSGALQRPRLAGCRSSKLSVYIVQPSWTLAIACRML